MTDYLFSFRSYRRSFRRPLRTARGEWSVREGIIVQLKSPQNQIGLGEIAPLPLFGSESIAEARSFCAGLGASVAEGAISQIPDYLPACQFAFGCALEKVKGAIDRGVWDGFLYSCLLPNGGNALDFLRQSRAIAPSYKWKIGVETIASEIEIFNRILKLLPNNVKLRLDANGGLTIEEARQWLELADRCDRVEFIEQPLAPHSIDETFALSQSYQTAIALDEAIANFSRLQTWHDLGWTGVYVIKAAIMGSPRLLKDFCADKSLDLVFSSVFETEIGRCDVLKLAAALGNRGRASGFGVEHWLAEEVT